MRLAVVLAFALSGCTAHVGMGWSFGSGSKLHNSPAGSGSEARSVAGSVVTDIAQEIAALTPGQLQALWALIPTPRPSKPTVPEDLP